MPLTVVAVTSLAVLFAILFWGILLYNRLTRLFNLKEEAWSGVDVQLKRRFDLVPNLVEVVKAYATHEQNTLLKVTEARSAVSHADTQNERIDAERSLSATLGRLLVVLENYPELKADAHFLDLQKELVVIEDDIQMARRYYNGTVREFNGAIQVFPAVLVSRSLGYSEAQFFSADESAKSPVKIASPSP